MPINTRFAYRRPATEGAAALQRRRRPSTRLHALGNALLSLPLLPLSLTHYVRPRDIRGHEQRCTGCSKSNGVLSSFKEEGSKLFSLSRILCQFFPQFDFLHQNIEIVVENLLIAILWDLSGELKSRRGKSMLEF